ncbi:MAG TPA: OB-fold domain-containing protein [Pseudonocardia sp.]|jgi:uncharacterized OB-fold protein
MADNDDVVILDPEHLALTDHGPVLLGSRCSRCGLHFFPRRWECAVDQAECIDVELSQEGSLWVSTYVHTPAYGTQALAAEGYGVGQVDLPEGVRVQAVLSGQPSAWVHGCRMALVTEQVGSDDQGRPRLVYRFAPV